MELSKSSGDATITCVGLAEDAFERLRHIAFEGEHVERMAALGVRTKLSPGVLKTLMRLSKEDGVSMGEMARAIGCDPSYITALVDDLDDRGLARRESAPDDRRVKIVVLTDAGRVLADGDRRRALRTACRLLGAVRLGAAPAAWPIGQGARGGGRRDRPEWNRGGDAAGGGRVGQDRGQRDRQSRGQRDRQGRGGCAGKGRSGRARRIDPAAELGLFRMPRPAVRP